MEVGVLVFCIPLSFCLSVPYSVNFKFKSNNFPARYPGNSVRDIPYPINFAHKYFVHRYVLPEYPLSQKPLIGPQQCKFLQTAFSG